MAQKFCECSSFWFFVLILSVNFRKDLRAGIIVMRIHVHQFVFYELLQFE